MTNAADESLDFWIALARVGFEEDLHRLMQRAGMNRTELAGAAGVSAAFISKILNESGNYTLKTMAKLARAVDGVLQVRLIDQDGEVVRIVDAETAARLDDEAGVQIPEEAPSADNVLRFSVNFNRSETGNEPPSIASDDRSTEDTIEMIASGAIDG